MATSAARFTACMYVYSARADACAAPVEDRQPQLDLVPGLARLAALVVVDVRKLEHADETGRAGEAQRRGDALGFLHRGLHVEALLERDRLESARARAGFWAGRAGGPAA